MLDVDSDRQTILFLNHSAQMSGAEASLRSLLRGLRQIDAHIESVIALPGEGPFSEILREEGHNVTLAPLRRLHRPRGLIDGMASVIHVLQTAPHICRLVNQTGADIIHSNSTTAHLVGGVAAERTGRPCIWHCRDLVSLHKIAPQLASRATRVIAISNCVADVLKRDGVPNDKILVVPNGIDTDKWKPRDASHLRDTLGLSNDAFIYGVVGQLVPWKNHQAFIEAAAQLVQNDKCDNARFAIIGGDLWGEHKGYVQELRALVKKYDLVERFNFIPHQREGTDVMAALDCLVHPALDEPFGRVVMEAMAMKKPVIAMNINGPREIITPDYDGLLVDPDAEDGLVKAMQRVLEDAYMRTTLGDNGRKTIIERFQITEHASQIAEIYRELQS